MHHKRFVDIDFKFDSKTISKSTNARIYKGVIILTPGKYADSLTKD